MLSPEHNPGPGALPAGPAALTFRSGRVFIADNVAVCGESVVASGRWEGTDKAVVLGWPRELIRSAVALRSGTRS